VLQLCHVLFGGGFLRKGPRQHKLGLKHRPTGINQAVPSGRHPFDHRMLNLPLHVLDGAAGIAFVPASIEILRHGAKLDDQDVGEILRLNLAALLPP
jgi:hypothetical protein